MKHFKFYEFSLKPSRAVFKNPVMDRGVIIPKGQTLVANGITIIDGDGNIDAPVTTTNITASGTMSIDGASTLTGAVTMASTLAVAGAITIGAGAGITQTDNSYTDARVVNYLRGSTTVTAGEFIALRVRAESEAAGASTSDLRGIYGQGIANAALYAGTITGVFGNAIAKDTSTVVTVRAGFFEAETEATPTAITNMYGIHTRTKAHMSPSGDYIIHLLETEKLSTGFAVDNFLMFKTTTWAGGDTVCTDVISTEDLTGTVTNIFNYSTVTATSFLYSDATVTNFLETSADSKGGAGATRGTPNQTATCDGSIVVKVGSKTLLIPLYNAVTIS